MSATSTLAPAEAPRTVSGGYEGSRVLVLYHTQTGQVERCATALAAPLIEAGAGVTFARLSLEPECPFPWGARPFFEVFPETVRGQAPRLAPLAIEPDERFDLIVLASSIWYLSPSLPVQALLRSRYAALLANTPVIALIGARNMWYAGGRRLGRELDGAGARHVANIAILDASPTWASFVTVPRWLITGRNTPLWKLPAAGIAERDIAALGEHAPALLAILDGHEQAAAEALGAALEAKIDRHLVLPDVLARRCFGGWARAITHLSRPGQRRRVLMLGALVVWLAFAIVVLLPLLALAGVIARPLADRAIARVCRPLIAPGGARAREDARRADPTRPARTAHARVAGGSDAHP